MTNEKNKAELRLAAIRAAIKLLEDDQAAIYRASLDAPASEKVCDDVVAEMLSEPSRGHITYPTTIHGIVRAPSAPFRPAREGRYGRYLAPGELCWVAIRPVDESKTYLGILLGDIATEAGVSLHVATGILSIHVGHPNPAILVPDLGRVIFGMESWWGILEKPEDLKQISDQDISNIWYVRALKALGGAEAGA